MPSASTRDVEIFWVVGSDTSVGKTTLATALIRVLNRLGKKTVGFKPHAGINFVEHLGVMEEAYPRSASRLFGTDTLGLACSSPLTSEELVEVINPSQRLHYPSRSHTVLSRIGSGILGNRKFFRSESAASFSQRPDIKRLTKIFGLPFDEAVTLESSVSSAHIDLMLPDVRTKSFEYLCDLGADAVVLEGAGGYLPVWQNCPMPKHIFALIGDFICFFPNVDIEIGAQQPNGRVSSTRILLDILRSKYPNPLVTNKHIAENKIRDSLTERIVENLLKRSQI